MDASVAMRALRVASWVYVAMMSTKTASRVYSHHVRIEYATSRRARVLAGLVNEQLRIVLWVENFDIILGRDWDEWQVKSFVQKRCQEIRA